jgi:hypothetical protein
MACPNCGSWSVRADRSLAGRMVCGRCGSPLSGHRSQASRSRRNGRFSSLQKGPLPRLQPAGWGLIALLALGAGLALLEPPPGRQGAPIPGRNFSNLSLAPSTQDLSIVSRQPSAVSRQPPVRAGGWQPPNP